jgi:orotate phosphoribosyltransferase
MNSPKFSNLFIDVRIIYMHLFSKHISNKLQCLDIDPFQYDASSGALIISGILERIEAYRFGEFKLRSGQTSSVKIDFERIYNFPDQLRLAISAFIDFPCTRASQALTYVPNGMEKFTHMVGDRLSLPVIDIDKTKDGFSLRSDLDLKLAESKDRILIAEDVVTTLGSVALVRSLFNEEKDVHSLAIMRRGQIDPINQRNLVDHYLLEREID